MNDHNLRKATHMKRQLNVPQSSLAITLVLLLSIFSGGLAQAQTENGPVCQAKTLTIEPLPADIELGAFSVDPLKDGPACMDPAGGKLKIVAVEVPGTLDPSYGIHIATPPSPGQTVSIAFTVQDQDGNQASTTLNIVRK